MSIIISKLCLHQLTIQKRTTVVIMADIRYKTKDKSNILKKLSKKFYTWSIKNSFHEIQVDVFLDPFKVRRERNSIIMAKKSISNLHVHAYTVRPRFNTALLSVIFEVTRFWLLYQNFWFNTTFSIHFLQ